MKNSTKKMLAVIAAILITTVIFAGYACFADGEDEANTAATLTEEEVTAGETAQVTAQETAEDTTASSSSGKALAAAICLGLAAAFGTIGMGIAISKSADGISRQPEAEGKIRTTLMLGLVFIETLVIYALVLSILIIFVL